MRMPSFHVGRTADAALTVGRVTYRVGAIIIALILTLGVCHAYLTHVIGCSEALSLAIIKALIGLTVFAVITSISVARLAPPLPRLFK